MGIFSELKERRIVQIVFSYLAAGWVFLEVIDQFADRNVLPEVAYYVALVWFLVGIPAALLIGWNHGEQGKQRAPRSEVVTLSLLGVLAIFLSGFTVVRMTASEVDIADYGPDPNRIAVLYFETIPPEADFQPIADGLTEALIEQLSTVPALDVISRNGVARFQGTDIPRDSIADVLDAGTLVGGTLESVRQGVRLSLQLYDASGAPIPDGSVTLEPQTADSILRIIPEMVDQASQLLRQKLGERVQLARRSAETNLTAWTLTQRAERLRRQAEERAAHGDAHGAFERFDRAHQLLAEAQRADTAWARPPVIRAQIEYRKSRLAASEPSEAAQYADRGIELADRALAIEPSYPEALAIRGTLRYWKHLLNVVHDAAEQERLLTEGREDLQRAVGADPTLAGAWNILSHMKYTSGNIVSGVLDAQKAYDADAYLDAADAIVWRLYSGNFDLENWTEARKWCEIGRERFPRDPAFINCPLDLMAAGAMPPDPELAWQIAGTAEENAQPAHRAYERINAMLSVGGVLAQAADESTVPSERELLQDSARAVIDRAAAEISPDVDVADGLLWTEAKMRVIAGQEDRAIDLLGRLIARNPDHAFGTGAEIGWEWRPLRDHPRFAELQRSDS